MSWAIVADSSCNLRDFTPTAPDTGFYLAPLKINVDGVQHVDDERLDVAALNAAIAAAPGTTSSSCPSPGEWAHCFRQADNALAITISGGLSGSYEAASVARNLVLEEHMVEHRGRIGGKNIFVLNSRAAGAKLELIVELLDAFLAAGSRSFEEAVAYATMLEETSTVLFSLSRYDNLIKNGRMPKLAGALATKLSIRMLGAASEQGTIKVVGSTRSEKNMIRRVVAAMGERGYHGGLVYIDHADNLTGAERLADAIRATWTGATVRLCACGGLCSYYAEQSGLIVGFEWT